MDDDPKLDFWNSNSFADWLVKNCDPDLVVAPELGVTVQMLIDKFCEIADREWSDGIDSMGEDA